MLHIKVREHSTWDCNAVILVEISDIIHEVSKEIVSYCLLLGGWNAKPKKAITLPISKPARPRTNAMKFALEFVPVITIPSKVPPLKTT